MARAHTSVVSLIDKMKTAFVLLLAGACALAVEFPTHKFVEKDYLLKQKDVLKFFDYVNQPSYFKDHIEYSEFKFEDHYDHWENAQYVKEFYYYFNKGAFLPKGEVFSVFYQEHLEQAIYLFKMFYYAKDYETFYKAAAWARNHINEGMYVYALSVAIVHRHDTHGLILPPIYEIYPHFFFNNEAITTAQGYKQHYWEQEDEIKDNHKGHTIHANYSGWYLNVHPEQSMSYFTEDIGMNSHYYYFHIHMPWWMEAKESYYEQDGRGEHFYFYHQQLLARYYLERLSNNFGEIPHFSYEHPIETGYYPSMSYPSGLSFPSRPSHASPYYEAVHGKQYFNYDNFTSSYTFVHDYERRIRDAIDMGYVYSEDGKKVNLFDKDGFNTLGNLIDANTDSPNSKFYGDLQMYARHFLGDSFYPLDEFKVQPSAMEHYETSLRDPMFWQLYKKITFFFQKYKSYLPHYTKQELTFDGVKVDGMTVDRLITYFDYFYSDISNAVYVDEKEFNENTFEVYGRQYRLNHKPFTYKVDVTSDKQVEAFVKIFIGPKYDEYGRELDYNQNRLNFVEFDRFTYTLKSGKNVIERKSHQSFFSNDFTTYKQLYQHIMTSASGDFKLYPYMYYTSMPERFLLPKGTYGGQTYQFYVMVSPYHKGEQKTWFQQYYVDDFYALGYPFDREINEYTFEVPNSYFKDVVIYHKDVEEINTTHSHY